jgi:glycosyltransferase involved in cell wall biosynthesis
MKLSVIIPVYNEDEEDFWHTLWDIVPLSVPNTKCEIVAVDDGSDWEIWNPQYENGRFNRFSQHAFSCKAKMIRHPNNRGKGAAIRTGLEHATGDLVIIQDADGELDPQDIPKLVQAWENAQGYPEGDYAVVYGTRFLKWGYQPTLRYFLGGKILTWITNLLYRCKLTDVGCGYKLFPTKLLKDLDVKAKGFEFCFEVTAKLRRRGIEIVEVPVSYAPRRVKDGKKLRCWHGLKCLYALAKYRLAVV